MENKLTNKDVVQDNFISLSGENLSTFDIRLFFHITGIKKQTNVRYRTTPTVGIFDAICKPISCNNTATITSESVLGVRNGIAA
jgi:Ni,Fe-hydrogenase III large subunit